MSDADYERKLDELDRLLNDPDIPMQARRVWALVSEIPQYGSREYGYDGNGLLRS